MTAEPIRPMACSSLIDELRAARLVIEAARRTERAILEWKFTVSVDLVVGETLRSTLAAYDVAVATVKKE